VAIEVSDEPINNLLTPELADAGNANRSGGLPAGMTIILLQQVSASGASAGPEVISLLVSAR